MERWVEHDSYRQPPGLAPAVLVSIGLPGGATADLPVALVEWEPGLEYVVLHDDEGIPYVSREYMDRKWEYHKARYVATGEDGCPEWFDQKPFIDGGQWCEEDENDRSGALSAEYRHPGDWRESLHRVWGD